MENQKVKILKAQNAEPTGKCRLDTIVNNPTTPPQPQQNTQTTHLPKALIMENTADFAIIQFTCSCGKSTFLKCSYK
jgi:hypothetical protein